jgi:hypothetical protein
LAQRREPRMKTNHSSAQPSTQTNESAKQKPDDNSKQHKAQKNDAARRTGHRRTRTRRSAVRPHLAAQDAEDEDKKQTQPQTQMNDRSEQH